MKAIAETISTKKLPRPTTTVKETNHRYEQALHIAKLTGLNTFFIMRIQKIHGIEKTGRLLSFLRDYPNLNKQKAPGLAQWFLKNK